uniref:PhzF family phenazine biosynthesis protein n=1 Tax=Eiseniibacteriota bacterium TaxID=2212470 RepID=A0A832IC85_UNCEI
MLRGAPAGAGGRAVRGAGAADAPPPALRAGAALVSGPPPDPPPGGWAIRWFTPAAEVDLCGHATLAAAHVVFERLAAGATAVTFASRSGPLSVTRDGERLVLDFPARPARPVALDAALAAALGARPAAALRATDLMAVFDDEDAVRALAPDLARVAALDARAVIVTAPGRGCDFVSRFFAPRVGVPEDPATGSAHCTLTPYWAARLGRARLHARQLSARGGELWCEDRGARVAIAGRVAPYLEGAIEVPA